MKKILVLGASSSKNSVNKMLATYAGQQCENFEKIILDLNDFEMPIYSIDREEGNDLPELAIQFVQTIESVDGVIVSLAEHNGSYTAAFKNILDWASRHKKKLWSEKKMLLLSTSPGPRGAATVMETAKLSFPHLGADIVASYSLPSCFDNFSADDGIKNESIEHGFNDALNTFITSLS